MARCSMTVMSRSTITPPLNAAIGVREVERVDEHRHAPRWSPARDREEDAGFLQLAHGGHRPVGEDLVLGDKRAVHVGQQQADVCSVMRHLPYVSGLHCCGRVVSWPILASHGT